MKLMILLVTILALSLLGLPSRALANSNASMVNFFSQSVMQVQQSLDLTGQVGSLPIRMLDLNFDVLGNVSFGLTDVLKLTTSLEIDFVLEPDQPAFEAN